jgi:hypothetical protein
VQATLDGDSLELTLEWPDGAQWPRLHPFPPFDMPIPEADTLFGKYRRSPDARVGAAVADAARLLECDFFGVRRRPDKRPAGPFAALPPNGKRIAVDPRRGKPARRGRKKREALPDWSGHAQYLVVQEGQIEQAGRLRVSE